MRTEYTDWVRRRYRCCVPGCNDASWPHHVRTRGSLGKQVDECNVVPLCFAHHNGGVGVHDLGRRTFARRYGVCLPGMALIVYADFMDRSTSTYDLEF